MSGRRSTRPEAQIRRRIKATVFLRDGGNCFWCEHALSIEESTLDHIVTASRGGPFKPGNLVLSCLPCNGRRGDTDAEVFLSQQYEEAERA